MTEVNDRDKLFFFKRNFFTLDGLWMIETETKTNWETALKIDLIVWEELLKIIIRRLKKYLNIEGNGFLELIRILTFRWAIEEWDFNLELLSPHKIKIAMKECPYKATMDRNPDRHDKIQLICRDFCIPFYQAVVENFNPKITLERSEILGFGDKFCSFIFSSEIEDDAIFNDDILKELPPKVSEADKLFYFERHFRTLDGVWMIEVENETDFETALYIDIKVWQRLYSIIFRRVQKYFGINKKEISDLINILSFTWNCEGVLHEIKEIDQFDYQIIVRECPYIDAMKRNPERNHRIVSICNEMCVPYLQPVIREFNKNISIERTKSIGLGDAMCDFRLSLKKQE